MAEDLILENVKLQQRLTKIIHVFIPAELDSEEVATRLADIKDMIALLRNRQDRIDELLGLSNKSKSI